MSSLWAGLYLDVTMSFLYKYSLYGTESPHRSVSFPCKSNFSLGFHIIRGTREKCGWKIQKPFMVTGHADVCTATLKSSNYHLFDYETRDTRIWDENLSTLCDCEIIILTGTVMLPYCFAEAIKITAGLIWKLGLMMRQTYDYYETWRYRT